MPFPRNFTWGAATASYQIEGAHDADGKGPSIWDRFSSTPGKIHRNHTGNTACEHYTRFKDDIALMKKIGIKAYRLSISWSRVMPQGFGATNQAGLDFYSRVVDELLKADIEPWVTLYHWDLPTALQAEGGWLSPQIPHWFEEYTKVVVDKLSDRVDRWFTINEPQVFIGLGLATGEHAPGLNLSLSDCLQAGHHALLAHGRSVLAIRSRATLHPFIGSAPVGICARPETESPHDIDAARTATFDVKAPKSSSPQDIQSSLWNSSWWMDPVFTGAYPEVGLKAYHGHTPKIGKTDMDLIQQKVDFFGANIYHAQTVRAYQATGYENADNPVGSPINSMGWDITPDALYWGGKFFWERYKRPIVITENGMPCVEIPDENGYVCDAARIAFINGYLKGVSRGLREGIPYDGYFYWSLMDNFEWAEGYSQRFGLIRVDYQTQKRTLKASAHSFAEIIASNGECLKENTVLPEQVLSV